MQVGAIVGVCKSFVVRSLEGRWISLDVRLGESSVWRGLWGGCGGARVTRGDYTMRFFRGGEGWGAACV